MFPKKRPHQDIDFPSFSEGLSLRLESDFIRETVDQLNFPSFSEGLSLRQVPMRCVRVGTFLISLPFRRDFH